MKKKKLCFIYGTRPEIIKLSPVIKLCQKQKVPFVTIHSGQHYSYYMDQIFFQDLNLPEPDYKLSIPSKSSDRQAAHIGAMLVKMESILLKEKPYYVIVLGDTNTVLAGAMAAKKASIKVAHIEAGLRSYDQTMPEETNRILTDHLSDFHFVPTPKEKDILLKEGFFKSSIHVTGNTIVDAVNHSVVFAKQKSRILETLRLKKREYILLTLHRQENVDSKVILEGIIEGLEKIYAHLKLPILFSIHPRTTKMLKHFQLSLPQGVRTITPVGFLDFLRLEAEASLIITDSGGLQEEACLLNVPCITLRDNTERPETLSVGSNRLAGRKPKTILRAALAMQGSQRQWKNPFWDGQSAQKILKILLK